MWILSFFPDFATHIIFVIGALGVVAGFLLSFIPFISLYRIPIQIISILVLSVGLYLEGGLANEADWKMKVKDLEVKIANAEAKAEKVNTKIVTKVITKIQVIKDTTNANTKYITEYVAKDLDADCKLTTASVLLHNIASQNQVSGGTGDIARGTSDVKASELLTTVTENYGTYYQVVEKLKGWQEWYRQQKKLADEAN
jgi:hypothetical protein